MGWTDNDNGWSDVDADETRDELLAHVRQRGDQLRTRRRVALIAALPVLLVAVLVPAALRAGGGARPTTVAAATPSGGAATTANVPDPTLLLLPTTTVAVNSTSSMPPLTVVAPTTGVPRTTPLTTVAPTTVPGTDPPPTTIPTTTIPPNQAPGPTCNPPMMTATAQTDKPSYKAGDMVRATATWTNTSGATCWYRNGYWGNWVVDATGKIVTPQAWPPFDYNEWRAFPPGETQSHSWGWDLRVCSANNTTGCSTATPGTYKIIFDYEPFAEPAVTLQVVAG